MTQDQWLSQAIGSVHGNWTVKEYLGLSKNKTRVVLCKCECGNERQLAYAKLKARKTTRCSSCASRLKNMRHGFSHHYLYNIWNSIKGRCHRIRHPQFFYYGARGITLYEPWHDIRIFVKDVIASIGERPNDIKTEYHLDRIDNDKGYFPGNIRFHWQENLQQYNNYYLLQKNIFYRTNKN